MTFIFHRSSRTLFHGVYIVLVLEMHRKHLKTALHSIDKLKFIQQSLRNLSQIAVFLTCVLGERVSNLGLDVYLEFHYFSSVPGFYPLR
jgi:hypothetical protein